MSDELDERFYLHLIFSRVFETTATTPPLRRWLAY